MITATRPAAVTRHAYSPATWNRRVTLRYACNAATPTTVSRNLGVVRRVRVHDISQGGIAVILRDPLQLGEEFVIQIRNQILGFSYDLVAHVRHITQHAQGRWLVGLAFVESLSMAELTSLV